MSAKRPAAADIRAQVHDLLRMTPDESQRLHGKACARCNSTKGLRDGGLAYTASGPNGESRLGWQVKVCRDHANTGGGQ